MNCEFPKPGRAGGLAASDLGQPRKFTAGENFFRRNARNWLEVILQPGQLLLYESARLPHGRTSFLRSGWHFDHHHILFILMMTFLIIYHTLPLVQLIAINMPLRIPPLHPFSQVPSLWSLKSWLDFEPQFILFSGARALPIYLFTFDQFPVRRNIFLRILFSYLIEYQRYYHSYLIRLAQRWLEANPC